MKLAVYPSLSPEPGNITNNNRLENNSSSPAVEIYIVFLLFGEENYSHQKVGTRLETRLNKTVCLMSADKTQDLPNRQDSFHFTSAEHWAEQQQEKTTKYQTR